MLTPIYINCTQSVYHTLIYAYFTHKECKKLDMQTTLYMLNCDNVVTSNDQMMNASQSE